MSMAKAVLVRIWYEDEDFEDADAQKYIEALLEEMENRSLRNGYPIEIELIKAKEED